MSSGQRKRHGSDWRSFWVMVALALQNAFNDKVAQVFLIAIGISLANSSIKYLLGFLILLPFILCSPLAGWFSDRFSKTHILRGSVYLQVFCLALMLISIFFNALPLAIFSFALLALQSTFFSPAKKGLIKEMIGSERIGFASGVMEMGSILAICLGQIIAGFWFDHRYSGSQDPWQASVLPLGLLLFFSLGALLLSHCIKVFPRPSDSPKPTFHPSVLWQHVGQMHALLKNPSLRQSALCIGFFWFFGGFINITAFSLGEHISASPSGFGTEFSYLISVISAGMVIGGLLASLASRRSIELGLIPLGVLLMVIGCLLIASTSVHSLWIKVWLGLAGAGGAFFLVPLNALLQDRCPPSKRGEILAGSNLINALSGFSAVGIQYLFTQQGLSFSSQFLILAGLTIAVFTYARKLLPEHWIRYSLLSGLRAFYRVKSLHSDQIPNKGGALLVSNHISYLDAFLLTAVSTRPIRFLILDYFIKKKGIIRFFLKRLKAIPISQKKPKDALIQTIHALNEGDLVCLFPEGQISRTGTLNELKRGIELIARKSSCPIIPVYLDGLWGTFFSFEGGQFFQRKTPIRHTEVTVAWGKPYSSSHISLDEVSHSLRALHAEAFTHRQALQIFTPSFSLNQIICLEGKKDLLTPIYEAWLSSSRTKQLALYYNALQLADTFAIRRRMPLAIDPSDFPDGSEEQITLTLLLPLIASLPLVLTTQVNPEQLRQWENTHGVQHWVGGNQLQKALEAANLLYQVPFYSINAKIARPHYYPIFIHEGLIVATSMPHPEANTSTQIMQAGWKKDSYGKLLPGYECSQKSARQSQSNTLPQPEIQPEVQPEIMLHTPYRKISLPSTLRLDSEGFLIYL